MEVFSEGQKYCIDCKSYEPTGDKTNCQCSNFRNISVNLVTGVVTRNLHHPDYLRSKDSDGCGVEGKWFKERK